MFMHMAYVCIHSTGHLYNSIFLKFCRNTQKNILYFAFLVNFNMKNQLFGRHHYGTLTQRHQMSTDPKKAHTNIYKHTDHI